MSLAGAVSTAQATPSDAVLHALPHPVITIAADGTIANANVAAEQFFQASAAMLRRHMLRDLVPFGSPLLTLIEQVRQRG
ncbi:MAG: PAS domain-containing protein, partial [Acidobacteriota bacterium]